MPKPIRTRKEKDFIQFRPYHAFAATPVDRAKQGGLNSAKRIVLLVGLIALIVVVAVIVLRSR